MATQIGGIRVQVNSQNPTVRNINYGVRSIRGSSDLSMAGVTDGDVISFDSANNTFRTTSVAALNPNLDAGTF